MSNEASPAVDLEQLVRAVLGAPSDAIIYAERAGLVQFWNPGEERLFGFAASEVLGRSLDLITPEPLRERHWTGFEQVMQTGESRYGNGDVPAGPGLRGHGTRIPREFPIVPVRAEGGRMEGTIAILRDLPAASRRYGHSSGK